MSGSTATAAASATTSSFSVREKQVEALKVLLNANNVGDSSSGAASAGSGAHLSGESTKTTWKILIYDDFCRDIISPLLNVGALRELGVTLHLALDQPRMCVPDVPAIYFCRPTEANIARIAQDLKENLYEQIHLNFAGSCPRALLERLAESALACDAASRIARVHDQYLGFQSLAPQLFTLAVPRSYVAFNDSRVSDAVAQSNIERCVEGLFAVLAVCGVTPVIRCPRNGAAEMVARALSLRLHEHSADRVAGIGGASSSNTLSSFRRPLLVVVERGADLATMMHHPWTYGAMVHDVLGLRLNRVRVAAADGEPASGAAAAGGAAAPAADRTFDLDARDTFWAANGGAPFQQVAVEVKEQVAMYKSKMAKLDSLREGGAGDAAVDGGEAAAGELGGFVNEIPELQAKKLIIETHTNIATALLKQVKRRELDRFYALEETLLARGSCDRAELRHLLGGQSGLMTDRVRLLLIYYLCVVERAPPTSAVATEFAKFEATLRDAGADLAPLQYVRQARAHLGALSLPLGEGGADGDGASGSGAGGGESGDSGAGWLALQKGYESLSAFTSVFADGVERLKTLLPREQELPITRIVRSLMENRPAKGVEQYLHFDPNVDGGRSSAAPPVASNSSTDGARSAYREAIVFVIGGGNYTEFQNLLDYGAGALGNASKRGAPVTPKTIVYGATELLTSDEFVTQMKALVAGNEPSAATATAASTTSQK